MIDIIIPTYKRPERIPGIIANIKATTPDAGIIFVCDEDESMAAAGNYALRNTHSPSWAGAINCGVEHSKADWVFTGADDIEFTHGWLEKCESAMISPLVGILGTNDDDWEATATGATATHFLARRSYIDMIGGAGDGKLGELIHEGYSHYCCEQETVFAAKARGRYAHVSDSIVKHRPNRNDEKAARNEENRKRDRELFDSRQHLWSNRPGIRPVIQKPADDYLAMLRSREPFSFARYGDGELLCMFPSEMKENCDGSRFLPELVEPMKEIFRVHHPYYHALVDAAFDPAIAPSAKAFEEMVAEVCPGTPFFNGEVWHTLAFEKRIGELASALSPCVLVGGPHLRSADRIKGFKDLGFIETPARDSFLAIDSIEAECRKAYADGKRVFAFATGYTSKILIHRLWPDLKRATLIDVGSVFDPFCGVLSRSGMVLKGKDWYKEFVQ